MLVTPEIHADQFRVFPELRRSDPVFHDETLDAWDEDDSLGSLIR